MPMTRQKILQQSVLLSSALVLAGAAWAQFAPQPSEGAEVNSAPERSNFNPVPARER